METLTLDAPTMYGDHHVLEVRRILLEMAGIKEVYASSCFGSIEVTFDATLLNADTIRTTLQQAGYTETMAIPIEPDTATTDNDDSSTPPYFRHTIAYKQTGSTVNFEQHVPSASRALWPCPGLGRVTKMGETDHA